MTLPIIEEHDHVPLQHLVHVSRGAGVPGLECVCPYVSELHGVPMPWQIYSPPIAIGLVQYLLQSDVGPVQGQGGG